MKPVSPFALVVLAPLALAACGESPADEPPPPTEVQASADSPAVSDQPPPEEAAPDEMVVEVDPEIGGTEPMEAGLPMADAAPMTDDFGMDEAPAE